MQNACCPPRGHVSTCPTSAFPTPLSPIPGWSQEHFRNGQLVIVAIIAPVPAFTSWSSLSVGSGSERTDLEALSRSRTLWSWKLFAAGDFFSREIRVVCDLTRGPLCCGLSVCPDCERSACTCACVSADLC